MISLKKILNTPLLPVISILFLGVTIFLLKATNIYVNRPHPDTTNLYAIINLGIVLIGIGLIVAGCAVMIGAIKDRNGSQN